MREAERRAEAQIIALNQRLARAHRRAALVLAAGAVLAALICAALAAYALGQMGDANPLTAGPRVPEPLRGTLPPAIVTFLAVLVLARWLGSAVARARLRSRERGEIARIAREHGVAVERLAELVPPSGDGSA